MFQGPRSRGWAGSRPSRTRLTSLWARASWCGANGSKPGWSKTSNSGNIGPWSGRLRHWTRKPGRRIASKAISTRRHHAAQNALESSTRYAQWREDGRSSRSKELGLCSTMTRGQANAILAWHPSTYKRVGGNQGRARSSRARSGSLWSRSTSRYTRAKWKLSTAMTELDWLNHHLVGSLPKRGSRRSRERSCRNCSTRRRGRYRRALSRISGLPAPIRLRSGAQRRSGGAEPCHYPRAPSSARPVASSECLRLRTWTR